MRIVRFEMQGRTGYGLLEGEKIKVFWGTPYDGGLANTTGEFMSLPEVTLLAPCEPTKIVAIGLNYRDHAAEFGHPIPEEPLIFMKPSTTVIGPDEDIVYPAMSRRVDYEAELAVVIGQTCRHVKAEDFRDYVLGYTCINDVTARDLQKKDGQFTRSKSFDTFAPWGPGSRRRSRTRTTSRWRLPERRAPAALQYQEYGLRGGGPGLLHLPDHDPAARRRHRHRHPFRDRPHAARRRGGNPGGRYRHVAKSRSHRKGRVNDSIF